MYPKLLQKFDDFLVKMVYKYANRKWYGNPMTKKIVADKDKYLALWQTAKSESFPVVDHFEKTCGFSIDTNFFHDLALHTQVVLKKSKINYQHGRILYTVLRKYIADHKIDHINIIETGTARGFSTLCMAKALFDSNIEGKILTYDVLPHNRKMYWNCIDDNEGKKTRNELLKTYNDLCEKYIIFHQGNSFTELSKISMTGIGFAFLDAGHDDYHVSKELKYITPFQKSGDIIVFDDYTPGKFPGVVKAVDEMCLKFNYSKEIFEINQDRAYLIAKKMDVR
jgi:predicted O-methyltransferase YrrM